MKTHAKLIWILLCLSTIAFIVWLVNCTNFDAKYFSNNDSKGELLKFCLTIVAGIGALTALYYTARRVNAMEKGNVDTRFNNAIGHLGSDNPAVVLGGIHAQHQIAVEHKNYTQIVHNLFCSFLRENSAKLYAEEKAPDKCPVIIKL